MVGSILSGCDGFRGWLNPLAVPKSVRSALDKLVQSSLIVPDSVKDLGTGHLHTPVTTKIKGNLL
jgi:hypothetical protein